MNETQKVARQRRVRALRIETLKAYGGKCVECGQDDLDKLWVVTTDQFNGVKRPGVRRNRHLRLAGFPKDQAFLNCKDCARVAMAELKW